MTTASLFGMETEFALSSKRSSTSNNNDEHTVFDLINGAKKTPYLLDLDTGIFLGNGARLYRDYGNHLEYSTPEVTNPDDMVAHVSAQEHILLNLAGDLPYDVRIWRANVCYYNRLSSWASHESHLYQGEVFADDLVPHLITRIIYTGAGGLNTGATLATARRRRPQFCLSPRSMFIREVISGDSVGKRGVFDVRDESLSNEHYKRLHIVFGESTCSQLSTWLSTAITNLVVLLSANRIFPGKFIQFMDPIKTLRLVNQDLSCKADCIELYNGCFTSALAVQRHYLKCIDRHLGKPFMPKWAADACTLLEKTLNEIESGFYQVSQKLDWAIKYTLFNEYLKNNFDCQFSNGWLPLNQSDILSGNNEKIWTKLAELDIRFSEIGSEGIFNTLDKQGLLQHQMVSNSLIEHCVNNAPDDTRAGERGKWIKHLSANGKDSRCQCNWNYIHDYKNRRSISLANPFQNHCEWVAADELLL